MLSLFLAAAGQVALVAVLLGAGLPALFAVGVRSFALAGNAQDAGPADFAGSTGRSGRSNAIPVPVLRGFGVLCFAIVIAAVAIGLTIIIATGFGQQVSFENIIPTFVEKG
ncbi:hypothetical protein HQQ81_16775 [Microbacteriaceae bacterium VKM Ac-2854]|nr:hypothetical protein [Microbacteriaceae bacterium VKM Ac-2854]